MSISHHSQSLICLTTIPIKNCQIGCLISVVLRFQISRISRSFYQFKGQIPKSLGQFKYLEYLDLSINSLHGNIPSSIGNLSSLSVLNLYDNPLINGTLPMSVGRLSNLIMFDDCSKVRIYRSLIHKLDFLKIFEVDFYL